MLSCQLLWKMYFWMYNNTSPRNNTHIIRKVSWYETTSMNRFASRRNKKKISILLVETRIPRMGCVACFDRHLSDMKKKKKKHFICPNNHSYPLTSILQWYIYTNIYIYSNDINASASYWAETNINTRKRFLHVTLLYDLIYVPTQYFQIISKKNGIYSLQKILTSGGIST